MTTTSPATIGRSTVARPGFWQVVLAYSSSDVRILWRMRTPIAFMIAVPAVLSVTLGPAISGTDLPGAQGRSMIGIAVMFSFMTVNYVGLALFREFNNHTWIRQSTTRPARLAYLLGKTLPVAAAGLVQLSIFGSVSFLVYGTPLHGSVWQLYTVAIALVGVGCAMGAVLYSITNTTSVFQSLAYIVLITTGCVGGTIVPFDRLPRGSQLLGAFTPQRWALRALDETTTGGGSWTPTLQATGLMLGAALLLGWLAVALLDYRKEKSAM